MTSHEFPLVERTLAGVCPQFETHQTIQSTNTRALALADTGAIGGTVVWANQQTMGRGRRGREWHSPPNQNVYLSIILRPKVPAVLAPQFTLDAACAVADALDQVFQSSGVRLKWPNDLVIVDEKEEQRFLKLGGILTELRTRDTVVDALVVGVGLNLGSMSDTPLASIAVGLMDLNPGFFSSPDGSLEQVRARLTGAIVSRLIERSSAFEARRGFDRSAWLSRALSFGRRVKVAIPGTDTFYALTVDLDGEGRLRVRRGDTIEVIVGGEVSF
jgi:BirA family biotin operon repressor/biotin-[acetyl-CoA-carboxylase] ligase